MKRTVVIVVLCAMLGCESVEVTPSKGDAVSLDVPPGFSPMPVPELNPLTRSKIALGERLFFDPILSKDRTVSCASCHDPTRAFSDPRPVSVGVQGRLGLRNSPTLVNVAYQNLLFWDGGAFTLENQALSPIEEPHEMDSNLGEVVRRLNEDATYTAQFAETFGDSASIQTMTQALASFERSIRSAESRYDRFLNGDPAALTSGEHRGFELFSGKGECTSCHAGPLLTTQAFENNGLEPANSDSGRARITLDPADAGKFKVPALRNVALTAPYMHDGRFESLEEVVAHYDAGGSNQLRQSEHVRPLGLTINERADLIAFLRALTDDNIQTGVNPE